MAIEFVCPSCGGTLQVGNDAAGRVIRCGGCQTTLRVPEGDPNAASQAPAPPASPFETESPPPPPRRRPAPPPPDDEPYPPEPRRRRDPDDPFNDSYRTRRRRPPAGRGVFFWLVIIGAVMFLGIVGCCGGVFFLLPNAEWHEYESPKGYKVDLPGMLLQNREKAAGINIDASAPSEGAVLPKRGTFFVVLYRDPGKKNGRFVKETDEERIEKAIKDIQSAVNAPRAMNSKEIKVNGRTGREAEFRAENNQWYAARVVVAENNRLFIVLAGGGFAKPGDDDVRRFLNSFELTNKKQPKEEDDDAPNGPKKQPKENDDDAPPRPDEK